MRHSSRNETMSAHHDWWMNAVQLRRALAQHVHRAVVMSEFQHSLKEADRMMELDVSLLVSTSSQGEKSTYPHRHAKDD